MNTTSSHRSISAAFSPSLAAACIATLAACSSSTSTPCPPAFDAAPGTTTYWLAPRTSEVDLQLVTTQPTLGF